MGRLHQADQVCEYTGSDLNVAHYYHNSWMWYVLCELKPLFLINCLQAVPSQQVSSTAPCAQAAQRLVQEASWTLREAMEVSSEALHRYRKRLQVHQAFILHHIYHIKNISNT